MIEIKVRLDELVKKINQNHKRLAVLRSFADLPGDYLVVLVERGLLSTPVYSESQYWHKLAPAMKDLDSVQRFLQHCRNNILRSCNEIDPSWEPMSDRWGLLIQNVESFKQAREGCLQIVKSIRTITEKLPEGFWGLVEDLTASGRFELLVLESESKKVRAVIEETQEAIEKLEGELGEMETERDSLIQQLRDSRQGS